MKQPDLRITTRVRKACGCKNTKASGPRFFFNKEQKVLTDRIEISLEWALMVCDECNTPWKVVYDKAPYHKRR